MGKRSSRQVAVLLTVMTMLGLAGATTARGAEGDARLYRVADRAGCPADGTIVTDRTQKTGPIIGVSNGMCVFQLPDGTKRNAMAWMLTTAGAAAPGTPGGGAASLTRGAYVCSMSSAGGQFPITIKSGSRYSDRAGKEGSYAISGKRITFSSGSLVGQYSEVLSSTKFGLSTRFNGMFYGICNLKK